MSIALAFLGLAFLATLVACDGVIDGGDVPWEDDDER